MSLEEHLGNNLRRVGHSRSSSGWNREALLASRQRGALLLGFFGQQLARGIEDVLEDLAPLGHFHLIKSLAALLRNLNQLDNSRGAGLFQGGLDWLRHLRGGDLGLRFGHFAVGRVDDGVRSGLSVGQHFVNHLAPSAFLCAALESGSGILLVKSLKDRGRHPGLLQRGLFGRAPREEKDGTRAQAQGVGLDEPWGIIHKRCFIGSVLIDPARLAGTCEGVKMGYRHGV